MTDTREIILKLKETRLEKNLSLNDIVDMTNGMVSKTTVQRVFSDGSENTSFRYDDTIRPLVKAMLDVDTIEDSDDMDTKALKSLLKLKIQRIEELELQLKEEKIKSHEKMEKERKQYDAHIALLNEQIAIKDKRMDEQAERFNRKDEQYTELVNRLLNCHCCSKGE
ncbi:MAG: hypothetical protein J6T10_14145 [Methanobrevibacter sp.]|nr:hypothetical protein [Methanobrevibacter sp.]